MNKTIDEERIANKNHLRIWEYIWTNRNIGFVLNHRDSITAGWFIKMGYLKKKKIKKETVYYPNMNKKGVEYMIKAFENVIWDEAKRIAKEEIKGRG